MGWIELLGALGVTLLLASSYVGLFTCLFLVTVAILALITFA